MKSCRASSLVAVLFVCGQIGLLQPASAEILTYQFSNPVSLVYDSNPLMRDQGVESIWRRRINPSITVNRVSENETLSANLAYLIERASDPNIWNDRDDPSLNLNWNRMYERGVVGANIGYSEMAGRINNLDDTGRAGSDNTRTARTAGLNASYALTELWQLSGNANYTRLTFDNGINNSRSYTGGATISYAYNERIQPYLRLTANRFVPDSSAPYTNLYGAILGTKWQSSPLMQVDIFAGFNQTSGSVSERDWQAGASLSLNQDKNAYTLDTNRSVRPAGNGGFISSESVSANWSRSLSNLSSLGIDISLRRNLAGSTTNAVGVPTSGEDTEIYQFNLFYKRQIAENWNMNVSAQHRKRVNETEVSGNILNIGIAYNFDKQ